MIRYLKAPFSILYIEPQKKENEKEEEKKRLSDGLTDKYRLNLLIQSSRSNLLQM